MLVLSRKTEESVVVGGHKRFECMLKITVLGIDGARVRLGFEANKDVPVHRWEVWEQIRASGRPERSLTVGQRRDARRRDELVLSRK